MASKVSSKRIKGATKVARCRVCHRELRDATAIAAGIGPICAANAAAARARTETAQAAKAFYPRERYERITHDYQRLVAMIPHFDEQRANAYRYGTPEQQVEAEEFYALVIHWCERWRRMQWRAYRLMTYGYIPTQRAS